MGTDIERLCEGFEACFLREGDVLLWGGEGGEEHSVFDGRDVGSELGGCEVLGFEPVCDDEFAARHEEAVGVGEEEGFGGEVGEGFCYPDNSKRFLGRREIGI